VFVLFLVTWCLTGADNASHDIEFESSRGRQSAAAFTAVKESARLRNVAGVWKDVCVHYERHAEDA